VIIPGLTGRVEFDEQSSFPEDLCKGIDAMAPAGGHRRAVSVPGFAGCMIDGHVLTDEGNCYAVSGNVDWLNSELGDIQIKRGPEYALRQAYQQFGIEALQRLGGRFSIFIWNGKEKKGLLATDRFGQMPVFWCRSDNGGISFAPTADALLAISGKQRRVSDQGIFNYLYFHMVPGPQSVFTGVDKLLAAQVLLFDGSGNCDPRRYWTPNFREQDDASVAQASEEMLGLLSSSVNRLAQGADTGAFLSGGLDSSTVAGLLARHQPHPKTYSIGFDAEGYDEIAYAKLASERFDTQFETYYVTPEDVVEALPTIAAAYDEPFGNSSALPAYFCAKVAAEDGRTRLLAGDGGDELFAGNERYAKQTVFEVYRQYVPGWIRNGLLEPLLFKAMPGQARVVSKARSYVTQANVPLPDRLQTYNFLNLLGLKAVISDALIDAIDPAYPVSLERRIYDEPQKASRLNRMLYLDWQHTLADNDLRKVNRMCQLAGIDVEYPMLDDRLVEFSTRVSSSRKMNRNRLRYFYKRAVDGFLPDAIINKSKHGFGLPFGVWMAEHPGLQELAMDNLARMKRRRYVRDGFIDEIVDLHRSRHAGYYGEMIWILIMLELWLTSHGIEP
jgi:asparagine synthase (glutamine-hydrolysing)